MRDRVVMVSVVLLVLIALGAGGIMFRSMQQTQQANQALVAALQKLTTGTKVDSGMVTVKFQLRLGTEQGPPVVGVPVKISGSPFGEKPESLQTSTDANGIATFGPIRSGKYDGWIGTAQGLKIDFPEVFYPGTDPTISIIVPDSSPKPLQLAVEWPNSQDKDWLMLVGGTTHSRAGDMSWTGNFFAGVDSDGRMYSVPKMEIISEIYGKWNTVKRGEVQVIEDGVPISGDVLAPDRIWLLNRRIDRTNGQADPLTGVFYAIVGKFGLNDSASPTKDFDLKQSVDGIWKIALPRAMKQTMSVIDLEEKLDGQTIDPDLVKLLPGLLVDAIPLSHDTLVYGGEPNRDFGKGNSLEVNNLDSSNQDTNSDNPARQVHTLLR